MQYKEYILTISSVLECFKVADIDPFLQLCLVGVNKTGAMK